MDIERIDLNELDCELPCINENGHTPLENSGLYFDELMEEEQPGQERQGDMSE